MKSRINLFILLLISSFSFIKCENGIYNLKGDTEINHRVLFGENKIPKLLIDTVFKDENFYKMLHYTFEKSFIDSIIHGDFIGKTVANPDSINIDIISVKQIKLDHRDVQMAFLRIADLKNYYHPTDVIFCREYGDIVIKYHGSNWKIVLQKTYNQNIVSIRPLIECVFKDYDLYPQKYRY